MDSAEIVKLSRRGKGDVLAAVSPGCVRASDASTDLPWATKSFKMLRPAKSLSKVQENFQGDIQRSGSGARNNVFPEEHIPFSRDSAAPNSDADERPEDRLQDNQGAPPTTNMRYPECIEPRGRKVMIPEYHWVFFNDEDEDFGQELWWESVDWGK
ncbi:hypothetical protein BDP27DRAFT_1366386 [Rhodocollybia butyracea]|uniref:Uncharacterized protein n=1 Tax=Rhodocollybia butyracea TaxID=206335 RepID=A0A9P5U398_9AGAR|nr:hypothetical protein BDP27DRAFT_1366386 [Rhodocollybia butyracea]